MAICVIFTRILSFPESTLDGCGKMTSFMRKAKEQGAKSLAFTEHGTIRQLTKLQEESENIGIRAIYGVELYMCDDMNRKGLTPEETAEVTKAVPGLQRREAIYQAERAAGILDRFHLTVLAKDQDGLRNLIRMTSLGWLKGFYKRPRVDLDCLEQHSKGLVVLSGCQAGAIGHGVIGNKDVKGAIAKAQRLIDTFGDDFYGEVMPHNMSDQIELNKAIKKFSTSWGMKMVATQDAHYIEPGDYVYQEAMLCIHTRTNLLNPNRFKFSTNDFWLKDRAAMEESFSKWHGYFSQHDVKESLDNTVLISEKCQAKLEVDRFKALVPPVKVPDEFGGDEFAFMRDLCAKGWKERGLEQLITDEAKRRGLKRAEMETVYRQRLERELLQIQKQKCVRYFLVVWDLYNWVRSQGIETGPGRGSVGGCLVAFLMKITDIDPIRFSLLFERFLSPDRIDLPDCDMDFEDTRREDVLNRMVEQYGRDKTALVGTNGKLSGKQCLKDIARVMGIPLHEIQPVVDAIIQRSSGDERASATIEDSFNEFPVCRAFNEKYPQVLDYANKLEGQVKSLGIHAAGVVVSPVPLIDICPLELRQGKVVTASDMYGVANLGLMKLDVLGLRNLTAMKRCREMVKHRRGTDIDWMAIPLDDEPTLEGFTKHNYTGIFQYDTTSADKISEGVEFTSFDDVAAMIALDRPGTARSGLATEYLKRKKNPKAIKSIHPVVDEICKDTLGVIVYQEHVMRIFTDVAGFSPATADSLRRKIAKKFGEEAIAKEREGFVKGAVARGFSLELAEKLISQLVFFGSYGFNRSHSVGYGLISYRQMWLKTHYTLEFMWSLLDTEPNSDEVIKLVRATRKMGITVSPPDVNSENPHRWTIQGDSITGSLSNIKGCGPAAVQAISATRPYTDFVDFVERVDRRKTHKGVITALLKAGALNALVPNPKWLLERMERIWAWVGKSEWQDKMRRALELSRKHPSWTEDEAQAVAAEVNPIASGVDPLEPYEPFISTMRDDWLKLDADTLWEQKHGFIWGRIIEFRYNQVGDFHSGAPPGEDEKLRMGWGKRYANINVEDRSGRNQRVKVDTDIFDKYRHIIDKGVNAIIAAHVTIGKQYHSIRASYLVDLDELKLKMEAGEPLTVLEQTLWAGWEMPISGIKPPPDDDVFQATAMVSRVSTKLDKRMGEMAFLGLLLPNGSHREALCFASSWPDFKDVVKQGLIANFRFQLDGNTLILDSRMGAAVTEILPAA